MGYIPYRHRPPLQATIATVYDYQNSDGSLLFQIVRFVPKGFRTRRPDGNGGWLWGIEGAQPVLYHLPEVLQAETVLIVEGEKDAETARKLVPSGWATTSNPFGAGQWCDLYSEMLRGKRVVICPDTDSYGQEHLKHVGLSLLNKATEIRVMILPATVKDLTEWVEQGGRVDQFHTLLEQAERFNYPLPETDLKVNIHPLTGAIDRLQQLQGVFYEWKEPETQGNLTGVQVGLIAQEVESVFPEWVEGEGNEFKTLTIRGFEALSVESFKTLSAQSQTLQQQCQNLETKLEMLETQLDKKRRSL
ncbi:tail fiber domain-containing protein [Kovacikia minuta CCNUW1]|uniref:tail fiber domain-containing protein n=1 Tax=Kovacikia minuta TaxID=2931930 RepID=UPI001CC95509|nr:tail fiber domain-containing protein [Kovacikia minuta]UBF27075.1 tail fiber domain-containing protein [Kovacikia minuta CCNUW1]